MQVRKINYKLYTGVFKKIDQITCFKTDFEKMELES